MSLGKKEPAKKAGDSKNPFKPGSKDWKAWNEKKEQKQEDPPKKEKKKEESSSPSDVFSIGHHQQNITKKAKGRVNRSGRMHAKFAKHAMNLHRGTGGDLPHHEELTFAEMFTQKFKNKLS